MAPSPAVGTTGLERVLLIFLMKYQQIKLQRPKPSPAKRSIQQSIGQNLLNSKELPRTQPQQHKIDSDAKTSTKTCNLNTNLPLLHQNSRFTGQKHERTVKTSIYRLKLAQAVRNFKKLIESSNKRWKTSNYRSETQTNGGKRRKWLHQHTTTQEPQKLQETHAVDGKHVLHGPAVGA